MKVGGLYVYPVKACGGVALDEAALGPLGLEHDRRFAFVHSDGTALTQREHPLLATIRPSLGGDALQLDLGGLADCAVGLNEFSESLLVDVWGKRIPARAAPAPLVAGACDFLGIAVRLVALDPAAQRAFGDSAPVLVTSSVMLAGLGVSMERFRPNIVVDGAETWSALQAKDALLERIEPCGRCEVTTIDQASGERRGDEPLRTLNERFGGNFGVYCRVARPGRLRRGEVLRAG
ncbi:MAG: MOSC domain-containing protein [Burkholderiales bacterium]